MKTFEYEVSGDGKFPFDMLRYGCAWPASEQESYKIDGRAARTVRLKGLSNPKGAISQRWASFGWLVQS
jgi:hypothetical protein